MPHICYTLSFLFFPTSPPEGGDWYNSMRSAKHGASNYTNQGVNINHPVIDVPFWGCSYKSSPKLVSFELIT